MDLGGGPRLRWTSLGIAVLAVGCGGFLRHPEGRPLAATIPDDDGDLEVRGRDTR